MASWEELAVLREIPNLAGGLHELQVMQLKMWPFVAAPHLLRHDFDWDTKTKSINYRFTFSSRKPPVDFLERLAGLDRSIKAMLGLDWIICIMVKKKVLYKSPSRGDHWRNKLSLETEEVPCVSPQPLEPSFRPKVRMKRVGDKVVRDE